MTRTSGYYLRPSVGARAVNRLSRAVNRLYGWLANLGLGPSYSYLLQIKGRRTGQIRSIPVNVLSLGGKIFLISTRGQTQWSRNALACQSLTLKRGRLRMQFRLRVVPNDEKPPILKAYLTRFNWMVRCFFPVRADSPATEFAPIASDYPVFELIRH
jgi:deazaflavin-dependent oxidoreductase (nitroreductase family)